MLPALATRETRLMPPTGSALQVILGSLLGDGAVDFSPTNPRLAFTHSEKQAVYVALKAEKLAPYVRTAPALRPNHGYGRQSCTFRTVTTPAFGFLRSLCYRTVNGRLTKTVTTEWLALLTWEGAAFWFMDDGTLSRAAATISTHSFPRDQVEQLAAWWSGRGISPVIDTVRTPRGKKCSTLRFRLAETLALVEQLRPFVHRSMTYKLAITPRSTVTCVACGAVIPTGHRKPGTLVACARHACRRTRFNLWRSQRSSVSGSELSTT